MQENSETFLYKYGQNNSGGKFDIDNDVTVYVYIEARTPEEAHEFAQTKAGIYFDGVDKGIDCECCGDRWYPQRNPTTRNSIEFDLSPPKYDNSKFKYNIGFYTNMWVKETQPLCHIYYLNGDVEIIYTEDEYKEVFESLLEKGEIIFPHYTDERLLF